MTLPLLSPPSSKCFHLLIASILLDLKLGSMHSSLSTMLFTFSHFPEDRLTLPTMAILLPVKTLLSLGMKRIFVFLAPCHFVALVLATLLAERQLLGTFPHL